MDDIKKGVEDTEELMNMLKSFISTNDLQQIDANFNTQTHAINITGEKDSYIYNVTIKKKVVCPISFDDSSDRTEKIKSLLAQGHTQKEVAAILGISQSLVSKCSKL